MNSGTPVQRHEQQLKSEENVENTEEPLKLLKNNVRDWTRRRHADKGIKVL